MKKTSPTLAPQQPSAVQASVIDDQLMQFLNHLHRGGAFGYWWTDTGKRSIWWTRGAPLPLPKGQLNLYFGVHPTGAIPKHIEKSGDRAGQVKPQRATRAEIGDVVAINCLFSEFDAKRFGDDKRAALTHIHGLTLPPSVIVDSGGGYHAYWLLHSPWFLKDSAEREKARELQYAWVTLTGGDDGAKDLARVLRVPGTRNHKPEYGPNFPTVCFVHYGEEELYTLEDVEREIQKSAASRPAPTSNGHRAPSTSQVRTRRYGLAALAAETGKVRTTGDGERNTQLNKSSYALGQLVGAGKLSRLEAESELEDAARAVGLPEREVQATIRSGLDAGIAQPRDFHERRNSAGVQPNATPNAEQIFPHTDLGNAERLVARHGEYLRHVPSWGWLSWNGARWERDDRAACRLAKDTVRSIYAEAEHGADEKEREAIAKWAMRSESEARISAMLALAESERVIDARTGAFDADPMLLNCTNGTLDLQTGALHPHNPADLLTRITSVAFQPDALCPIWLSFLDRIFAGNVALIEFTQRAIGYSLTGGTDEQCLFFCYGTGANGKSTFLETIRALLGEYAQAAEFSTFLARKGESVRNDIARMVGTRFIAAIEAGDGRRLNETVIKALTGGDTVTARHLYHEYFEFRPAFKVWLAANHKPVIRGTDNAIWRRIRLIPFTVTIPQEERDPKLPERLRAELQGCLAWAVKGCLEWQASGLQTPAEVRAATDEYRAEQDVLAGFIDECCLVKPGAQAPAAELYAAYKAWAEAAGEIVENQRAFGLHLSERGYKSDRGTNGFFKRLGIGLLTKCK